MNTVLTVVPVAWLVIGIAVVTARFWTDPPPWPDNAREWAEATVAVPFAALAWPLVALEMLRELKGKTK